VDEALRRVDAQCTNVKQVVGDLSVCVCGSGGGGGGGGAWGGEEGHEGGGKAGQTLQTMC
jgi:hypothetical protein